MQLTMKESGFRGPNGTYLAKFAGVEANQSADYGEGIRWIFEVTEGEYSGEKVSRITGRIPTHTNICGKILLGLAGGNIHPGQSVCITDYVGINYIIVTEQTRSGVSRIASLMRR